MNPRLSQNISGNPTLSVPLASFNAGQRKLIMLLYLAVNISLSVLFNCVLYGHGSATISTCTIMHINLLTCFEI